MKPILFNTEMVRAILDGRKTQTRRIMKQQPPKGYEYLPNDSNLIYAKFRNATGEYFLAKKQYMAPGVTTGTGGDILWVRETWAPVHCPVTDETPSYYAYRTDFGKTEDDTFPPSTHKWHPSIHMPREAARLFLRVTNVRVERLQEITEEDALKEGAKAYGPNNCSGTSARIAFAELWDGVYNNWRENPWVWVYEFERVSEDAG